MLGKPFDRRRPLHPIGRYADAEDVIMAEIEEQRRLELRLWLGFGSPRQVALAAGGVFEHTFPDFHQLCCEGGGMALDPPAFCP